MRFIRISLIFCLFVVLVSYASPITGAVESTSSSAVRPIKKVKTIDLLEARMEKVETHKNEIRNKIETLKEKVASKNAERKIKLEEKAKERILHLFEQMMWRMKSAIERMDNIVNRIGARIHKLNEEGVEVSKLEIKLEEVRVSLREAREMLIAVEAEFKSSVIESDNRQTGFTVIKNTVNSFKQKIKDTHDLIKTLVLELKSINEKQNKVSRDIE